MIIHVTKEDIKNGLIRDGQKCPIANAIQRELQFRYIVTAGCNDVLISPIDYSFVNEVSLPDAAIQFVKQFDSNTEVNPFDFELEYNPA